jgi:hypothetical protein
MPDLDAHTLSRKLFGQHITRHVRPGNTISRVRKDKRKRAHSCSADADQVNRCHAVGQ